MRYLSVCAGIEAATVAWHPLGWTPAAFSEIDAFPRAVLAHHYPDVPLHGDFTTIKGNEYGAVELLVGGTPCQDFSVAGLRAGLAGDRGNLTLEFLRLAARARLRWIVWENVPGVLSIDGGRAFGAVLGGMAQLGYGFAYRILDAQFFGLAQRRERVFVVGHLGDWRRAAAVLFESASLRWNPPPRRQAGQGIARPIARGSDSSGGYRNDADTADNLIAHTLIVGAIAADAGVQQQNYVAQRAAVRRLTPRECERLQGFPDDWTRIPWRGRPAEQCPDGPRYKALGNSMAVPVMRWIGERIALIERLVAELAA